MGLTTQIIHGEVELEVDDVPIAAASRSVINFINGQGIDISVVDDPVNDESDVTIAAEQDIDTGAVVQFSRLGLGIDPTAFTFSEYVYASTNITNAPLVQLEQTSTGDCSHRYALTGGASYEVGIDNTDDSFKVSYGSAADAEHGTNDRFVITTAGLVGIGASTNANMTIGLTINQGAADDEAFALKSSDVAHGMTSVTETDTYFTITKVTATAGNPLLRGLADAGSIGMTLQGIGTVDSTDHAVTGFCPVTVSALKKNSATTQGCGADANLFGVEGGGGRIFIIDKEGQIHVNETSTGTFPTIDLKQSSTGDVGVRLGLASSRSYMVGVDNEATGVGYSKFKVSTSASATAVMGTTQVNYDVMAIDGYGSMQSGPDGAGNVADTTGYFYVRCCAGKPTGKPQTIPGYAAVRMDSTNKKMYTYGGDTDQDWVALN